MPEIIKMQSHMGSIFGDDGREKKFNRDVFFAIVPQIGNILLRMKFIIYWSRWMEKWIYNGIGAPQIMEMNF